MQPPPSQSVSGNERQPSFLPWHERWIYPLIFVLTVIAYLPAFQAGFVWDDPAHVTRPELRSLQGLWRIWTDVEATQQYYPLLNSSFWLAHRLWGDAALGYHVLNVLIHATGACLLVAVARRLSVPGAWLAGLIFALHPVAVESVAWITEQKNTQSTLFYLWALLLYLKFEEKGHLKTYAWATTLFACALLSKSVTVTLPAAILVILWWKRGRLTNREVKPLLLWFALSIGMGLLTRAVERDVLGAQGADFSLTTLERFVLSGRIAWFYFAKLLWPFDLIFIYPRWHIRATDPWAYVYTFSAIAVVVALWRLRTRTRTPLTVALLFLGTAFPVLGYFNVYGFVFSYVADHWNYLPSLPIVAAIAASLVWIRKTALSRVDSRAIAAASVVLLAILGTASFRQTFSYRDLEGFYRTIIAKNPGSFMPYNNLAVEYARKGRQREAVDLFKQSLALKPEAATCASLGTALRAIGNLAEAIVYYEEALKLKPDFVETRVNLAATLEQAGRGAEAIPHYEQLVRLRPTSAELRNDFGAALAADGRFEEAGAQYREALRLRPDFPGALGNLGMAMIQLNRPKEALAPLQEVVLLQPDAAAPRTALGIALAETGDVAGAVAQFEHAVRLEPNSPETHENLARGLGLLGRQADSDRHSREAARLRRQLRR